MELNEALEELDRIEAENSEHEDRIAELQEEVSILESENNRLVDLLESIGDLTRQVN